MTPDEPTENSRTFRLDEREMVLDGEVSGKRRVIAPRVEADRLWTPEEVAHFLGVPIHTLYRWRYLGTGPKAGRVGRHLRYLPADVIAWFRQQQMGVTSGTR
jgi:predicted DNA-binding transcriptional regulator AlpA